MRDFQDKWGLITGASSGIGAEFARQSAAKGIHLVLVARREEKLRELADQLTAEHGVQCEVIACDLTDRDQRREMMQRIDEKKIVIDLLVNNAGFGMTSTIDETDVAEVTRMLRLNIACLTELTYRYLPSMLQRRCGAVINLASLAAFQPLPYMEVYAASKSYVLHFSESLWAEARSRDVTVLAICPGFTQTDFLVKAGMPLWTHKMTLTPAKVVRRAFRAISSRRQYAVPGVLNYFASLLPRFAERRVVVKVAEYLFRPKSNSGGGDG